MKITKQYLKKVIAEELQKINEMYEEGEREILLPYFNFTDSENVKLNCIYEVVPDDYGNQNLRVYAVELNGKRIQARDLDSEDVRNITTTLHKSLRGERGDELARQRGLR